MSAGSVSEHRRKAQDRGPVSVALITVSDTRTEETDVNGRYLREQLAAAGHSVHSSRIVRDEPDEIRAVLDELTTDTSVHVLLFNGGTGLSRRDRTFDVISGRLDKTLSGFGEIFRMLSYEQVGAAAMLSRATAGVCQGKVVFSTPGSPAAVGLAWEKLIASELSHITWELVR
jgi:molybdenum cofactor biosynthesis protein B